MSLHGRGSSGTENHVMVQRREGTSKPPHDSKTQEEEENEELSLVNALNPGEARLAAGRPALTPPPLLAIPELGPREPTGPPLYDKEQVSPSKTHQGT